MKLIDDKKSSRSIDSKKKTIQFIEKSLKLVDLNKKSVKFIEKS